MKKPMSNNLTKKQLGFIGDVVKTGDRLYAARNNFDVKNDQVARSIAYKLQLNQRVQEEIERLTLQLDVRNVYAERGRNHIRLHESLRRQSVFPR